MPTIPPPPPPPPVDRPGPDEMVSADRAASPDARRATIPDAIVWLAIVGLIVLGIVLVMAGWGGSPFST